MRGSIYTIYLLLRLPVELATLKYLQHIEGLSEDALVDLQEERVRAILRHAYTNVPYYKRLIEKHGGIRAIENSSAIATLQRLPFLTKKLIRENWEDLKSHDLSERKWYYNTSGGSTGEPVRLIQDHVYHQQAQALKELYDLWTGYWVGAPKVILWGSERDILQGKERWKVRFGRWLRNERWLNAFRMKPADMNDFVKIINVIRPVQILAYAEAMYELAKFIEQERLNVHSPHAIMTSAGTLYNYMRETIQRVFGAPVFNRYGSREVGDIACECEVHQGLHVCPVMYYVEILREDGSPARPGEVGEVVVTSLTNYAMPLIRYRIGDMAAWAETSCSCGRSWPLLKEVTGRVTDTFVSASRTKVNGEYFTHLLYFRDWIKKFQFVQESYTRIRLLIIPAIPTDQAKYVVEQERAALLAKVRAVMGPECILEIELVDDIPLSPSGKYRYTISKVSDHE
ncbi:MAG: phenylacetate--CoA ligase family protein [Armatimonadota bacterium]